MKRAGPGLTSRSSGFTLIELIVVVTIVAMMAAFAMPAYKTWIANAKVRALAETTVANLRQAQSEAFKRYRRVVYYRSDATICTGTPAYNANGSYWVIKTIPLVAGDGTAVAQCGALTDGTSNFAIGNSGPLCFGTNGRPVAVDTGATGTGIGVACTVPGNNGSITYTLDLKNSAGTQTISDRQLAIVVNPAGGVRMCDTKKSLSNGNPDGC